TERTVFLKGMMSADKLSAKNWNSLEWMYFLDGLPDKAAYDKLQKLDAAWHLTGTVNAEIGSRWYAHAIASGIKSVWPSAADYVTGIGRLYLIVPVYRALAQVSPDGLAYAKTIYARAKEGYHPLTQQAVEALLAESGARWGS
ncbi:MAG TPA: leukotriene A4 hydrolase C-terminal domain-containing protein, partial [Dyella sp.]|uniref:leukotriene A4 hydrolase C-terminal domain-containing protein n=1 Tax=Dyella sp. TaxID=1869338 RepID=UPI002F94CDF3